MSGKTPLVHAITGYTVAVFKEGCGNNPIMEEDLRLSKVGGAHITNVESLVMMMEDAVFQEEKKCG